MTDRYWKDISKEEKNLIILGNFEIGTSAGDIEKTLPSLGYYGATRNAIIGHIHRNMQGIFCMGTPNVQGIVRKPRKKVERIGGLKNVDKPPKPKQAAPRQPEPIEKPDSVGKLFMDLGRSDCRFPLWPHDSKFDPDISLYCGNAVQVGGSSYCRWHHSMCNPPTEGRLNGRYGR